MTKTADWDNARTLCAPTEYGAPEWRSHYREHPDVLTTMLGDLYRVYKAEQDKANGTSNPRGGRRKSTIDGNLDELWSIITPRFSMLPFPQALDEARGKRTYSQIAMRAGLDRRRLSHLVTGCAKAVLQRADLEAIAKALDLHPAYFREWRLMVVQELIADVCEHAPHLSIGLIRALSR